MRGSSPTERVPIVEPVLVTGAGGFIGGHLCRRLAARGISVRGMVRRPEQAPGLWAEGVRPVVGDLTRPQDVREAMAGCGTVIHCAAWMGSPPSREAARATNVGGTRLVAEAAAAHGVARVVHLSSITVYGPTTADCITEDSPLWPLGWYRSTKIDAEREICAARGLGVRVVVLRPGQVFGPGDRRLARRALRWLRRGWPLVADGGRGVCHPVYVGNLADAVLAACAPVPEGVYNVADGDVPWRMFLGAYAAAAGRRLRSAPAWALRTAAALAEVAAVLTRRPPLLSRAEVGYLVRRSHYSTSRAREVLGWTPQVDLVTALERTMAYLRQTGWLREEGGRGSGRW